MSPSGKLTNANRSRHLYFTKHSRPISAATALGQAAGATLAAFTGTFLLHRFARFDRSLSRLRDAFSLLVIGALASAAVSASIGTLVLFVGHERPYSGIGSAWLIYWLGDAMGVLLVTPLVLTFRALLRIRNRDRLMELVALLVLLTTACVVVFGDLPQITERRLAEQAIADMSRKLVAIQEEERTRIARELHDDINQRLALLAIETEALRDNLPNSGDETGRRLEHIREGIVDVSTGVQSISHQLHSSQLEYLGIGAAMKIFCTEYSARQSVEIDFTSDEIPKVTSPEISLGLFRIMQEALSNATKHSRVRHFQVELGCSADQLHLTVSDSGNESLGKSGISWESYRSIQLLSR
jgi:signal transduction histidine kinase